MYIKMHILGSTLVLAAISSIATSFPNTRDRIVFSTNQTDPDSSSSIPTKVLNCVSSQPSRRRWHNETERCYNLYRQGPCPKNMHLIPALTQEQFYGECECQTSKDQVFVYHNETDQCYALFTQGYCQDPKQWLVSLDNREEKCVPNPCLTSKEPEPVVQFKGKCVSMDDTSSCSFGSSLGFTPGDLQPSCISETGQPFYAIVTGPAGKCLVRGKRNAMKKCPAVDFTSTIEPDFKR